MLHGAQRILFCWLLQSFKSQSTLTESPDSLEAQTAFKQRRNSFTRTQSPAVRLAFGLLSQSKGPMGDPRLIIN